MLNWALQGLQQEIDATRDRLAALEAQARTIRSTSRAQSATAVAADAPEEAIAEADATTSSRKTSRRRKRKLSPEARNRIADAQKRRWEAYREAKKK